MRRVHEARLYLSVRELLAQARRPVSAVGRREKTRALWSHVKEGRSPEVFFAPGFEYVRACTRRRQLRCKHSAIFPACVVGIDLVRSSTLSECVFSRLPSRSSARSPFIMSRCVKFTYASRFISTDCIQCPFEGCSSSQAIYCAIASIALQRAFDLARRTGTHLYR
ncbi:hypothetical protein PLICRDRAFT_186627 [Plicaturopsis crispa FD-325 SS-3]|nr:hypothetical protein PLICRDRAFT_186627 [Plicaturopsis crispa FD-325 SS-3]